MNLQKKKKIKNYIKFKELPVAVRLKVNKVKSNFGKEIKVTWESGEELRYFKQLFRNNLENRKGRI